MLLRELQNRFAADIFSDSLPNSPAYVVKNGIAAGERLAIYRNNVLSNLRGALRDSYPVIFKLLGETFFNGVATEYARAHPSRSGDLHDFGGEFADFLQSAELRAKRVDLPAYLPDMARLEWAWDQAFHAQDSYPDPAALLSRLQSFPPQDYARLRFQINPSVALLNSDYPILDIWQAHQLTDNELDQAIESIDPDSGGARLLVKREPDFLVSIAVLGAGEFAFLCAAKTGALLEAALTAALAEEPSFDLGQALHRFVVESVIIDVGA